MGSVCHLSVDVSTVGPLHRPLPSLHTPQITSTLNFNHRMTLFAFGSALHKIPALHSHSMVIVIHSHYSTVSFHPGFSDNSPGCNLVIPYMIEV